MGHLETGPCMSAAGGFVGSSLCARGWTLTVFAFPCWQTGRKAPALQTSPRGNSSRDQLRIFDLPSASISVTSHHISGFIPIRFSCSFIKQTVDLFQNSVFGTDDTMPPLQDRHTGDFHPISPSVVSSGSKGSRPCWA